jgi:Cu/Ag efflux protein CusF
MYSPFLPSRHRHIVGRCREQGLFNRGIAMFSLRTLVVVALLVLQVGIAPAAEEKTIDGCKVVKVDGTKLTVEKEAGQQHTADVAADATITLDGKSVKLADLKEGTKIKVTVRKDEGKLTITKVEATTK